jgi:hypothetical protein
MLKNNSLINNQVLSYLFKLTSFDIAALVCLDSLLDLSPTLACLIRLATYVFDMLERFCPKVIFENFRVFSLGELRICPIDRILSRLTILFFESW